MAQVGHRCCLKCFAGTFLEIMAATAVAMQVDATRHNVHAMGIDGLVHASG